MKWSTVSSEPLSIAPFDEVLFSAGMAEAARYIRSPKVALYIEDEVSYFEMLSR